jgi:phosphoglycolate phosphatase
VTAIAFDLDGCLIDSKPVILPSVRVALTAHGLPALPDEDIAFLIGPPLEIGFVDLLERLGADPSLAPELVLTYRADYRQHMLTRTTMFPGVEHAARTIASARGGCVVTSKPADLALPIVSHLGLLDALAFVEGPTLEAAGTESKVVTLGRALERLDIAVMVGDRHHDVEAGRAHGLLTVGVLWGMGDEAELVDADHLVRAPGELIDLLVSAGAMERGA